MAVNWTATTNSKRSLW